jgi:hypothetical protein
MSEVEKIESQKTVVAFISGLLIGGLLVWVFSSSPEAVAPEVKIDDTKEIPEEVVKNETKSDEVMKVTVGEGSVLVSNQTAGKTVVIDSLSLPTESGWIVVREFTNGSIGNILGAARYSVEEGLIPKSIELIRGTTAGGTYQVVFFKNEGAVEFNLSEDTVIDGIATTFDAI